jgi:hypothetical protein
MSSWWTVCGSKLQIRSPILPSSTVPRKVLGGHGHLRSSTLRAGLHSPARCEACGPSESDLGSEWVVEQQGTSRKEESCLALRLTIHRGRFGEKPTAAVQGCPRPRRRTRRKNQNLPAFVQSRTVKTIPLGVTLRQGLAWRNMPMVGWTPFRTRADSVSATRSTADE